MFRLLAEAFKEKDVRQRMFFTLGMLIIFRIGTHITVPGVNASSLSSISESGLFNLLNIFGGGALSNFSIFALGISPFITSSIIMQLLQMDIIPVFSEWADQGEVGRRKLNQVTRYMTIAIAFVQALGISLGFNALSDLGLILNPGIPTYLMIALFLTAGTMLVVFLSEQISVNGIGNGSSLIIFSGIVAKVPQDIMNFYSSEIRNAGDELNQAIILAAIIIVAVILLVIFVVFMETGRRKIPVQYTKRVASSEQTAVLPLKVNSAGVIPVIFASSFIMLPQIVLGGLAESYAGATWYEVLSTIFNLQEPVGAAIYALLIVVFTYFYAHIQVDPEKMSENFQKQGAFIPSIRPGKDTQNYISYVLNRLSTVGAFYLMVIAVLPIVASMIWDLPTSLSLGGTSLLIVVGVALSTKEELEGLLSKRSYLGFIRD
ncbi:MAG: preprotein translocase subunit SecY [Atopococcus tabaci]|uniref:Protein translocase subunit SecY n=1 Tax=Atopococcus tabaci TaxID=269774 RepID=A0AA43UD89_9LACT|nr:preprotein translocase subunit SecY [Atopococcus tabaci]